MNREGSDPVRLTEDPAHDYLPASSPDQRSLTFASWRTEEGGSVADVHVYVMNPAGSVPWAPHQVADRERQSCPGRTSAGAYSITHVSPDCSSDWTEPRPRVPVTVSSWARICVS